MFSLSLFYPPSPLAQWDYVRILLPMKAVGFNDRSKNKREEPTMKSKSKSENREDSYVESDEERNRGHVDARSKNFECEKKTSLGCDPGIDVAG